MMSDGDKAGSPRGHDGAPLVPLAEGWAPWPIAMLRSAGLSVVRAREFADAVRNAGRDGQQLRAVLERFAAELFLLEALSWQNPALVNSWVHRDATRGAGVSEPARYRGKLAALGSYLHRYATKNETVGFFGPIGWAVVDPSSDCTAQAARTGAPVRIWEHTGFEPWAIGDLTRAWNTDPEVRWHLPVAVNQAGVLDGSTFLRPRRRPVQLTADQQAVLEALATHPDHAADLLKGLRAAQTEAQSWTRERVERSSRSCSDSIACGGGSTCPSTGTSRTWSGPSSPTFPKECSATDRWARCDVFGACATACPAREIRTKPSRR